MSCTGCELISTTSTEHATLYLMTPLAHTAGKVRKALVGRFDVAREAAAGVLRIPLGDQPVAQILHLVADALSNPELRACRAVLLHKGETFGLQHLGSIQSLHSLMVRHESGWLRDLLQQGGCTASFSRSCTPTRPDRCSPMNA